MKPIKKQAVLYARFSPRPDEDTSDSINKQIERLQSLCLARDWDIDGEPHTDVAKSAKTASGRTGLEAAVAHACRIRGVLVVYDWSRLTRDVGDGEIILRRLKKARAELASVADNTDLTTPAGRLSFRIITSINQYTREVNNIRTSTAMVHHQKTGRRMGRADRCPFGFRAGADKTLVVDEGEQAVIAKIVALRASGTTYRGICAELDREGVDRRGKTWEECHAFVRTILRRAGEE